MSLFFSTKNFPRWLDGSCIEAQPQQVPDQDQPVTYTFFTDVVRHPDVIEIGGAVKDAILQGVESIMACVSVWKRYRLLWRVQRVSEMSVNMSVNMSVYKCVASILISSIYFISHQIHHSLLQSSIS